jgi:hypothetical protein
MPPNPGTQFMGNLDSDFPNQDFRKDGLSAKENREDGPLTRIASLQALEFYKLESNKEEVF